MKPLDRYSPASLAVLFVDPDMESARPLANAISRAYSVAIVPSAQAARHAISIRTPDVLVTELDLPDINGVSFLESIRRGDATQHVMLMVVTRRMRVGDKVAAFQAGADDYLVKPVAPSLFQLHMATVLRFRKLIQF